VARKPGPLEALATEIRQRYGTEIRTLALDLTADDMLKQLEQVTQDIEVGLLIYNAGSMDRMPEFLDDTHEGVLHTIERNVVGPAVLCHHFGREMRERGRGGILLVSSLAALAGCGRTVCYAATKAFDQILAEGLWYELRPSGVDVLCLMLGTTRTPAMERLGMRMDDPANPAMDPDDAAREGLEQLPHGPTWIAGEGNRASAAAIASLSRREATEMLSGVGEDVLGDA
jgi:short-subunit dehydrogenase